MTKCPLTNNPIMQKFIIKDLNNQLTGLPKDYLDKHLFECTSCEKEHERKDQEMTDSQRAEDAIFYAKFEQEEKEMKEITLELERLYPELKECCI